ncbi:MULTISPECIES: hypothetical protein [Thiothrix]|uniref:Uncharacterized protein n=2 Tax=Thiothrix TaxID=1030 RepID=A0A1H4G830_9GAMM|nr:MULTISPECIES: hypothetical protein [Thiothrix]MDQ5769602.1 hypothetical protein [Thiothrix subterranea]WML85675.1 hypothetical protein RCG00_15385 [Thiothrix subterranea]SEB05765.1 hypothetical protein SAMN05660964_03325 [Thiothrix caldifontis]
MNHLSAALKTILNGLAMQYEGELLTTEDKKANLQRVLTEIEREKQDAANAATTTPTFPNMALHTK